MKNYIALTLAAVPGIVAVAPAATLEDYVAALDEQYKLFTQLQEILGSVNDLASADAAAAKIHEISKKVQQQESKVRELGIPTPEQQAQLKEIIKEREATFATAIKALIPLLMNLTMNDCYGSEALKQVLDEMNQGPTNSSVHDLGN